MVGASYNRRRSSYADIPDCIFLEHGFPSCPNSVPTFVSCARTGRRRGSGEMNVAVVNMVLAQARVLGTPLRFAVKRHPSPACSGLPRSFTRTRQDVAHWQRARVTADSDDAMRMMRTCVNPNAVARVMQHCTHSDPWRAPRGQTFAEGHHGAERYRHAFSVTMAAFKQAAQALPKTPSRQSLRRPYCGTERQLIGTCTTGTFFGTNDGHGS